MRIWYVTMVFPTPSETFVCTEVAALREHGMDVSVHSFGPTPADGDAMRAEHRLEGIHTDALTAGDAIGALGQCFLHLVLTGKLKLFALRWCAGKPGHLIKSLLLVPRTIQLFARAKREKPDVVHLFWGHYPSLLGHLIQKHLPDVVLSSSLSAYDLRIGYGGATPVARRASFVRTWAAVNVPEITALGVDPARIEVVYQLVDCDRAEQLASITKIPHRVVTAGRLIPAKGMDELLQVFAAIHNEWNDSTLVILGDGPERQKLEALARELGVADAVTFRGHVPYAEVFAEMAAAEVFLFMSHHPAERLPNVAKEAILARCLCVVTDTPGMDELVRDGEHGYVVAPHDVDGAIRRVCEIFSGDTDTGTMRDAALMRLEENFDVERVIPALIARWRRG